VTGGAGEPEAGGGGAAVADELRQILAEVTGHPEVLGVPAGTALLGGGVGLDSLGGTLLLRRIRLAFGVDVAGQDLNLDCMATLGTLAAFIEQRAPGDGRPPGPPPG
jgi:acyl carrier protein